MRFASINNAVLGFLLLTTIVAVYVIASPGSGDNWIINPLTGITAIAFSLLAFARLSVGAPNRIAKHIWRGTILVFCTVAASQFLEGYRQLLSQKYGIDDIADCVLLVVSPVTMWMISKFDPPPLFTRGLFLLGFLLQSVSTVLDVLCVSGCSTKYAIRICRSAFLAWSPLLRWAFGGFTSLPGCHWSDPRCGRAMENPSAVKYSTFSSWD